MSRAVSIKIRMKRRLRLALLAVFVATYFFIELRLLLFSSPIYEDGSGPQPTLFWSNPGSPSPREYSQHHVRYLFRFLAPYCTAALFVTIIGCVLTPKLLRSRRWKSSFQFAAATALTLVFLLAICGISDLGSYRHWWDGPLFFTTELLANFALAAVTVPAALLSGIFVLIKGRLLKDQRAEAC